MLMEILAAMTVASGGGAQDGQYGARVAPRGDYRESCSGAARARRGRARAGDDAVRGDVRLRARAGTVGGLTGRSRRTEVRAGARTSVTQAGQRRRWNCCCVQPVTSTCPSSETAPDGTVLSVPSADRTTNEVTRPAALRLTSTTEPSISPSELCTMAPLWIAASTAAPSRLIRASARADPQRSGDPDGGPLSANHGGFGGRSAGARQAGRTSCPIPAR